MEWTDAAGHVRVALDRRGRPVRYLRNAAGQRIAKLWPGRPDQTRWFVFDEGRQPSLVLDAKGRLRRIFVVLDHLPLAVIDIDPARPGARISWVHADYRGLPRAVTDARGHTVWQGEYGPYGRLLRARTRSGPVSDAPVPWRLPGQYADPETGLTLNDLRTFDPVRASYLTPDPLGLRPTGLRMAYAENRPYDRADPLGLYEIDIHYYMTYFIARTAGIEHESAYRIALAAQGIDDNPLTQPINQTADGSPDYGRSLATNQDRLLAYHFVLSERVPGALFDTIETPSEVPLANPSSPQLDRLMAAVHSAGDPCAAAHLLGEFVHAFQDTYAHRDHTNRPYDPLVLFNSIGLGHGLHMHDPDWTFNHNTQVFSSWSFGPMGPAPTFTVSTPDGAPRMQYLNWTVNEARTLQMERDLHARLLRFGNPDDAVPFEMIEPALREFNAIHEWQQHGKPDEESFPEKIGLLEEELRALGYGADGQEIAFRDRDDNLPATTPYDRLQAERNRRGALCGGAETATGHIPDPC